MFEKVLLPIDFSEQSMMMFDCVMELKHFGTKEAFLLYVTGKGEDKTPEQNKLLENLISNLKDTGIEAKVIHKEGDPVDKILEAAKEEKVTLISMASSGKGRTRELLVGSTSFGVLRSSKKPVLIDKFKVTEKGGKRIVRAACTTIFQRAIVPVDFTECSDRVLQLVPRLCRVGLGEVILFHVVESSKYNVRDGARFKAVTEKLDKLREDLRSNGCNVSTHVHFGTVSYNILEATRELDATLIVLGAHGKSLLREMTLGGNSEEVIRKAEIPLLVIPC